MICEFAIMLNAFAFAEPHQLPQSIVSCLYWQFAKPYWLLRVDCAAFQPPACAVQFLKPFAFRSLPVCLSLCLGRCQLCSHFCAIGGSLILPFLNLTSLLCALNWQLNLLIFVITLALRLSLLLIDVSLADSCDFRRAEKHGLTSLMLILLIRFQSLTTFPLSFLFKYNRSKPLNLLA